MASVREIIKEACIRINLVPRKQAVPGDILETGYNLLRGIVSKYNYDNLLNFTQNSVIVNNSQYIHIYDESDFLAGKNNMYFASVDDLNAYTPTEEDYENSVLAMVYGNEQTVYSIVNPVRDVYVWNGIQIKEPYSARVQNMVKYQNMQHFKVPDVAKINSIYLVTKPGIQYAEHLELKFVPANKFDAYTNDSNIFTVTEKSEGEWLIQLKPIVARLNYRLKINYNEAIEFDLDSDLYIPDNYVELLMTALAHKLALQYPRLDDAQMQRLENDVRVLVDNVRTPKAVTRMILRDDYFYGTKGNLTQSELMSGYWI